jgi:hypothetical protein
MFEYIICLTHFINGGGRILQLYPNPKETYVAPTFPSLSSDVHDKYSNLLSLFLRLQDRHPAFQTVEC